MSISKTCESSALGSKIACVLSDVHCICCMLQITPLIGLGLNARRWKVVADQSIRLPRNLPILHCIQSATNHHQSGQISHDCHADGA